MCPSHPLNLPSKLAVAKDSPGSAHSGYSFPSFTLSMDTFMVLPPPSARQILLLVVYRADLVSLVDS